MIRFTKGNLLEAKTEALVNTVNTVGVMGKGIALMFKEAFPKNFRAYASACKAGQVRIGEMFVTERTALDRPRWIINFPTKKDWRGKTRLEWIEEGLIDLERVIRSHGISTIAVPPLGCGNGGLDWPIVRNLIQEKFSPLSDVHVLVFEPTATYQNVAKRAGVEALTPARAVIAELVRRYWVMGIECSMLEIQKLAWFAERQIASCGLPSLNLRFDADRYGPYSDRLRHLLNTLDGSYLLSDTRIPDARPGDVIAFNDSKQRMLDAYLRSDAKAYLPALDQVSEIVDGFESPLGLELLATVDWLLGREARKPTYEDILVGLGAWPGGNGAGMRKRRVFDRRLIGLALERLAGDAAGSDHGDKPG